MNFDDEQEMMGRVLICLMNRLGLEELKLSEQEYTDLGNKAVMVGVKQSTHDMVVKITTIEEAKEVVEAHKFEQRLDALLEKLSDLQKTLQKVNTDETTRTTKTDKPN